MANMSSRKISEDGPADQPNPVKDENGEIEMVVLDALFQGTNRIRVSERLEMPIYENNVVRGDPGTIESMKLDTKTGILSIIMRSVDPRFRGQTATIHRMSGLTAVRIGKIPDQLPPDIVADPNEMRNVKHKKFLIGAPPEPVESERTLKPVEAPASA
jgi:hypothetical protein